MKIKPPNKDNNPTKQQNSSNAQNIGIEQNIKTQPSTDRSFPGLTTTFSIICNAGADFSVRIIGSGCSRFA